MSPKPAAHLAWQLVDGEGVIVDLDRRKVLGLNPVASLVWPLLEDHDEPALVAAITREFGVDEETARTDLRDFLHSLATRGLVTDS